MPRYLRHASACALLIALTAPANAQSYTDFGGTKVEGVLPLAFMPNGNKAAPFSVSTSSASVALPYGTTALVQNTGANAAYVSLSTTSGTATASDIYIPAGASIGLRTAGNAYLNAITASGSTTINVSGGVGILAMAGGGGVSGGGSITATDGALITLGATGDTATYNGSGSASLVTLNKAEWERLNALNTLITSLNGKIDTLNTTAVAPVPQQTVPGVDIGATEVAPDVAPATKTISAADAASSTTTGANSQSIITGTPTTNSAASFTLTNAQTADVQVTGTWVGTLASEISIDGGTTWYTQGLHQIGTTSYASSFTSNFGGELSVAGRSQYRVRATAYTSGTATVAIRTSANSSSVHIAGSNAVPSALGTTNGWTPKLLAALTNTAVQVKATAGSLGQVVCSNQGAAWAFVQVYSLPSGVTVGTTTPVQSYGVAPGLNGGVVIPNPGLNVGGTGISVAATTTQTGSTAPGTALDCNAGYN